MKRSNLKNQVSKERLIEFSHFLNDPSDLYKILLGVVGFSDDDFDEEEFTSEQEKLKEKYDSLNDWDTLPTKKKIVTGLIEFAFENGLERRVRKPIFNAAVEHYAEKYRCLSHYEIYSRICLAMPIRNQQIKNNNKIKKENAGHQENQENKENKENKELQLEFDFINKSNKLLNLIEFENVYDQSTKFNFDDGYIAKRLIEYALINNIPLNSLDDLLPQKFDIFIRKLYFKFVRKITEVQKHFIDNNDDLYTIVMKELSNMPRVPRKNRSIFSFLYETKNFFETVLFNNDENFRDFIYRDIKIGESCILISEESLDKKIHQIEHKPKMYFAGKNLIELVLLAIAKEIPETGFGQDIIFNASSSLKYHQKKEKIKLNCLAKIHTLDSIMTDYLSHIFSSIEEYSRFGLLVQRDGLRKYLLEVNPDEPEVIEEIFPSLFEDLQILTQREDGDNLVIERDKLDQLINEHDQHNVYRKDNYFRSTIICTAAFKYLQGPFLREIVGHEIIKIENDNLLIRYNNSKKQEEGLEEPMPSISSAEIKSLFEDKFSTEIKERLKEGTKIVETTLYEVINRMKNYQNFEQMFNYELDRLRGFKFGNIVAKLKNLEMSLQNQENKEENQELFEIDKICCEIINYSGLPEDHLSTTFLIGIGLHYLDDSSQRERVKRKGYGHLFEKMHEQIKKEILPRYSPYSNYPKNEKIFF